jgi:hypothetical protein
LTVLQSYFSCCPFSEKDKKTSHMADHNVDPAAAGEWPQGDKASLANDGVPGYAVQEEDIHAAAGEFTLPPGRKYKQLRLFGYSLPWYASPKFQLGMVAFVCFLCPGMFNALSGLGGGGKQDHTLADNMVSAVPETTRDGLPVLPYP